MRYVFASFFWCALATLTVAHAQQPSQMTPSQQADTLLSGITTQSAYLVTIIKQEEEEIRQLKAQLAAATKPTEPPKKN